MSGGVDGAYREVLRVHDARTLILASAASQVGDWLYNAALLAYVYTATGSAAWVGAATVFRLIPFVVLGPVGGVVADRYDRRSVLLAGDLARATVMVALAATVAADGHVAIVIALTALASAAGTAERPAAMSLLPRLVGEARLGPANALLHTVQEVGIVVGPALGAVLLATGPAWSAFVANAIMFVVSAGLIATLQRRAVPRHGDEPSGAIAELVAGLRTTATTRYVLPLLAVVAMVEMIYGGQAVQLVLYAQQELDIGDGGYGYLLAASGIGGVVSAAVNGRLAGSHRAGAIAVGMGVVAGATQLAFSVSDVVGVAVVVSAIGGIGLVSCEVVAETALARVVPAAMLGRVMGVFDAVSVGFMVLGAIVAPVLTSSTSLRTGLAVMGVAAIVVTLACLLGLRGLSQLSRRREEALHERLAVLDALPITVGLPRVALEQLAAAAQVCPLPTGVDVVVQGAPAHAFYAVVDGGVVVARDGEAVGRIGAGGHFGERGLLDNAPRNATVTTDRPSTLLRLDGDVLLEALQVAPSFRAVLDRSNRGWSAADAAERIGPAVDDPDWTAS